MDELIEKNPRKLVKNGQKLAKIEKYPENLKKDRIQSSWGERKNKYREFWVQTLKKQRKQKTVRRFLIQ